MPSVSDAIQSLDVPPVPFADDAPLETLFPGAGRKATLEQLQHLSRFSADITALVGPQGSGKTTLGDFFIRQADKDQMTAIISGNLLTSPGALLTDILNVFVVDYQQDASVEQLRASFVEFLNRARERSRSVVLLVDDAHELGDEAFSLMVRLALELGEESAFHLILLGESPLIDMLECTCPLKKGRNPYTISQLEAFSLEDTRRYLRFRLSTEGFGYDTPEQALPFSDKQLLRIHKQSAGIPGVMHALAAFEFQTPQKSFFDSFAAIKNAFPAPYAYGALALFAVLLAVLIFSGDANEPEGQDRRSVNLGNPLGSPETVAEELDEPELPSPFVPPPTLRPVAEQAGPSAEAAEQQVDLASVEDSDLAEEAEAASASVAALSEAASAPSSSPAEAAEQESPPEVEQVVAPEPELTVNNDGSVMGLPPEKYTIQLLGVSTRSSGEDFLRRNEGSPLYLFEAFNRRSPWFVVIHGVYDTRAEASAAVARLGPRLAVDQPWIRRIGDVQGDASR
ncbi:MAG: AAA family ATPase [Pseudohongiellaceae bacterium]|nr:AAA family ATPase [Pseudohongiellaceae bacterium]